MSDKTTEKILVEVAYALPDEQYLYAIEVPAGTTALQAVELSPLKSNQPDLVVETVGIFSKPVPLDYVMQAGDRVEIYRPLKADPKARRRKAVEEERKAK